MFYIYRLDLLSMCYFIFQNICEQLEEQKLNQTSQILSKLTTKDIISLSDPVKTNTGLEEVYEEAVNLITFEKYKAIKAVPSDKIKKYVYFFYFLFFDINSLKQ